MAAGCHYSHNALTLHDFLEILWHIISAPLARRRHYRECALDFTNGQQSYHHNLTARRC